MVEVAAQVALQLLVVVIPEQLLLASGRMKTEGRRAALFSRVSLHSQ